MKGFILGIVTMILILALGLLFALMGFVSMSGQPSFEVRDDRC